MFKKKEKVKSRKELGENASTYKYRQQEYSRTHLISFACSKCSYASDPPHLSCRAPFSHTTSQVLVK